MSARTVARRSCATLLAAALVAAALATSACTPPEQDAAEPDEYPIRKGTIVFDMGHGEIFGAEDTSELGQSQAIAQMRAAGYDVIVNADDITVEDLEGASGLIIAGPMSPLDDAEYIAITSFLEAGGTVLLTIHVPFPVLKVPAHWGLPVGTQVMLSPSPDARGEGKPSIFATDNVAESPLAEGVDEVLVVSGWPVATASESAELLVSTPADCWLSNAGDQAPTPPADAQFASFGVVGVANVGKGRVVVSGDDAIFANLALGEADNAKLLGNIIDLMTAATEI